MFSQCQIRPLRAVFSGAHAYEDRQGRNAALAALRAAKRPLSHHGLFSQAAFAPRLMSAACWVMH
eukprot:5525498-Alexandrium_andersonii.AAC.1